MSRKSSQSQTAAEIETRSAEVVAKHRQPRFDPTPVKVFCGILYGSLSLVMVALNREVLAVFMVDTAKGNYSDVTPVPSLVQAATGLFKGKSGHNLVVAQFANTQDGKAYGEKFADQYSQGTLGQATSLEQDAEFNMGMSVGESGE